MADSPAKIVHATALSLDGHGVLLTGKSGSGKSTLALRLVDQPGRGIGDDPVEVRLIGDDQVIVQRVADKLLASPAPRLAGLLEVRGVG